MDEFLKILLAKYRSASSSTVSDHAEKYKYVRNLLVQSTSSYNMPTIRKSIADLFLSTDDVYDVITNEDAVFIISDPWYNLSFDGNAEIEVVKHAFPYIKNDHKHHLLMRRMKFHSFTGYPSFVEDRPGLFDHETKVIGRCSCGLPNVIQGIETKLSDPLRNAYDTNYHWKNLMHDIHTDAIIDKDGYTYERILENIRSGMPYSKHRINERIVTLQSLRQLHEETKTLFQAFVKFEQEYQRKQCTYEECLTRILEASQAKIKSIETFCVVEYKGQQKSWADMNQEEHDIEDYDWKQAEGAVMAQVTSYGAYIRLFQLMVCACTVDLAKYNEKTMTNASTKTKSSNVNELSGMMKFSSLSRNQSEDERRAQQHSDKEKAKKEEDKVQSNESPTKEKRKRKGKHKKQMASTVEETFEIDAVEFDEHAYRDRIGTLDFWTLATDLRNPLIKENITKKMIVARLLFLRDSFKKSVHGKHMEVQNLVDNLLKMLPAFLDMKDTGNIISLLMFIFDDDHRMESIQLNRDGRLNLVRIIETYPETNYGIWDLLGKDMTRTASINYTELSETLLGVFYLTYRNLIQMIRNIPNIFKLSNVGTAFGDQERLLLKESLSVGTHRHTDSDEKILIPFFSLGDLYDCFYTMSRMITFFDETHRKQLKDMMFSDEIAHILLSEMCDQLMYSTKHLLLFLSNPLQYSQDLFKSRYSTILPLAYFVCELTKENSGDKLYEFLIGVLIGKLKKCLIWGFHWNLEQEEQGNQVVRLYKEEATTKVGIRCSDEHGKVYILSLAYDQGIASFEPRLRDGQYVLKINGEPVDSHEKATRIISTATEDLEFCVRAPRPDEYAFKYYKIPMPFRKENNDITDLVGVMKRAEASGMIGHDVFLMGRNLIQVENVILDTFSHLLFESTDAIDIDTKKETLKSLVQHHFIRSLYYRKDIEKCESFVKFLHAYMNDERFSLFIENPLVVYGSLLDLLILNVSNRLKRLKALKNKDDNMSDHEKEQIRNIYLKAVRKNVFYIFTNALNMDITCWHRVLYATLKECKEDEYNFRIEVHHFAIPEKSVFATTKTVLLDQDRKFLSSAFKIENTYNVHFHDKFPDSPVALEEIINTSLESIRFQHVVLDMSKERNSISLENKIFKLKPINVSSPSVDKIYNVIDIDFQIIERAFDGETLCFYDDYGQLMIGSNKY